MNGSTLSLQVLFIFNIDKNCTINIIKYFIVFIIIIIIINFAFIGHSTKK